MRHPFVSNCRPMNECSMANKHSEATVVVTRVSSEQDHGLRNLERRVFCRDSGILSMASFEGTVITVGSAARFLSIWAFRGSASFQFVLAILLLAVDGLLSILFRLSSSCEERCEFDCRDVVCGLLDSLFDVDSSLLERPPAPSKAEFKSAFDEESSPSSSAADPDDRLRI